MKEEKMNDELENRERQGCFCQSKGFRKFLAVALGSFFGVLCALCLFCLLHRPYMMPNPMFMGGGYGCCRCHCHHHHFNHDTMKNNIKFYKELREYEQKANKDD